MYSFKWEDLGNSDRKEISRYYAKHLNTGKKRTVLRILDIVKPVIVYERKNENTTFRIHESYIDVMKVLIKNYL